MKKLINLCSQLSRDFPIQALPARIDGSRWAFCGKRPPDDLPVATSHRLRVNEEYGIIAYGWSSLSSQDQQSITDQIRSLA